MWTPITQEKGIQAENFAGAVKENALLQMQHTEIIYLFFQYYKHI